MKVKSGPKAKKPKSKDVQTGALGVGDAYAYGIGKIMSEAKEKKGSDQESWLGVSKKSVDMLACCDREKLHGKK